MILTGLLLYILAQLIVGAAVSTRVRSNEDYVLAGRSLGYGMGTFTIFATWFGAESCVATAGRAYESGLVAGEVDPFGYALCLVVLGLFFAYRLWTGQYLTMGDIFRRRFGPRMEKLAVLLLVPTSLLWGASQLRAFGQVLYVSANLPISTGILLALVVTLIYTVAGGMWADAITDLIQGIALIFGLGLLFVIVIMQPEFPEWIQSTPAERFQIFPTNEERPWYVVLDTWMIPILNAVVCQELIARTLASRSATIARHNCLLAAAMYLLVGLMPIFLGVLGPQIIPDMAEPEHLLPILAQRYLPGILYVLFAGAIISALLSTIDSCLLVSATLMANNFFPLSPTSADRARLRWSRVWVVLLGLTTYMLALSSESVFELSQSASSLGASGLFVVVAFGLFTRWGGEWTAIGSSSFGLGLYLYGDKVADWNASFLISLLGALCFYLVAGFFESGKSTSGTTSVAEPAC
jgi:solute:Na+ symporter, SSS family